MSESEDASESESESERATVSEQKRTSESVTELARAREHAGGQIGTIFLR